MKKSIFVFLLVLGLMCAMPAFAEQTEEQRGAAVAEAANAMTFPTDYTDYVADCPACGEKQVTWKAIKYNGRVEYNAAGHYYCDDITASPHTQFIALDNGGKVCLHLNGQDLSNAGRIAVLGGGSVINIMGNGSVTGTGTTTGDTKQGVLVVQNAGTINLYGGTYTSALTDMPVVFDQHASSVVNLYSGATIDSNVGHNVDVINGTFNMYGGVIKNAVTTGSGGNVRLRSVNGRFNMYGGTISGGESSATNAGGNVYITGGSRFNMYGGTITDGQGTGMYSHGKDVYVYNGAFAMYGGTVDGQVAVNAGYTVHLDGRPVIKGSGLWLEEGAKVTWGELKQGAAVTVCGEGAFTDANENAGAYANYFNTPSELSKIVCAENVLYCESDSTADSQAPLSDGKSLKVLALTSSFGLNTTEFLYDIAVAQGATDVVIGRLYASGCTLQKHVTWANDGTAGYEYTKNSTGTWEKTLNATLLDGLLDEDWDIIYLQQSGANSPAISTYGDYIDQLTAIVNANKTNPDAQFVWNMTWAYQSNSTQPVFVEDFNSDQMAMYTAILNTVRKKVQVREDIAAIIPSGTAIQNARTSYFGDTLTVDTYHLNNLGRVIAGYTAYAVLTDTELTQIKLDQISSADIPQALTLTDSDKAVILEAVNAAVRKPYEVAASSYTEPMLTHSEVARGAKVNRAAQAMIFPTDYTDYVADCPACGEKQVTWKAIKYNGRVEYNAAGHYYCDDITASPHTQFIALDNGGKVCLHLNGQDLSNAGRIAVLGGGSVINIMGNGSVTGTGTASGDYKQGVLVAQNAGTINLYGGTYRSALADMPVVYTTTGANPKVNMYEGTVIDSNVGHNVDVVTGTFNMYGGEIKNAVTTGSGGNVRLRSSLASFNMYWGAISGGSSSADVAGGNIYMTGGSSFNLYDGAISGGEGTSDASVGGNIYINSGTFIMFDGKIAQSTGTNNSEVFMTNGGGSFKIADGTEDPVTIKGTFASATFADGKVYIDVKGNVLSATGTGTLYAFDSANDGYDATACGRLTVQEGVQLETDITVNGKRYIAIRGKDGTYSFHRLNMYLTAVSLRTSACGIYYKAKYECDDVLAGKISAYGVVFSVDNMPGADFMTEEGDRNLFTVYNKDSFVSGVEVTSGSIFNIMKEDCDDNASRGEMPIYANAYIIIDGVNDEQPLMAGNGVAYSLLDVLKTIDTNWDQYVEAGQTGTIKTFYSAWAQYGMDAWADKLVNIDA